MSTTVAIIPARGGSKGIPRKNIHPLAGKPLLAWTVEAALDALGEGNVYVSTEDDEIAGVARRYGAGVIHRPMELAGDTVASEPVIAHALQVLGDAVGDVAFIQPTSPFLRPATIREALEQRRDPRFDSVITVEEDFGYYGRVDGDGLYHPVRPERKRRQEMEPFYRDNGALYLAPRAVFLAGRRMGDRVGVVVMSHEDSWEIDTPLDWAVAEQIAAGRLDEAAGAHPVHDVFRRHAAVLAATRLALAEPVAQVAGRVVEALRSGHKVLALGNGGSAADAQHLVAELVGRMRRNRPPLPAIALTTNTSTLTAIGNDYGFREVFCRQVAALVQPGDVVFAFSTSGNSENVVAAAVLARQAGAVVVGLTGEGGGRLAEAGDHLLAVPDTDTQRIQEMHGVILHTIVQLVEDQLFPGEDTHHE